MSHRTITRNWFAVAIAGFCVIGCGGGDEYMPMKINRTWIYRVRYGFEKHTVPIRVDREITVADSTGYEQASLE